jgi:hypothetical protein
MSALNDADGSSVTRTRPMCMPGATTSCEHGYGGGVRRQAYVPVHARTHQACVCLLRQGGFSLAAPSRSQLPVRPSWSLCAAPPASEGTRCAALRVRPRPQPAPRCLQPRICLQGSPARAARASGRRSRDLPAARARLCWSPHQSSSWASLHHSHLRCRGRCRSRAPHQCREQQRPGEHVQVGWGQVA